jgi:hypothetical protein
MSLALPLHAQLRVALGVATPRCSSTARAAMKSSTTRFIAAERPSHAHFFVLEIDLLIHFFAPLLFALRVLFFLAN